VYGGLKVLGGGQECRWFGWGSGIRCDDEDAEPEPEPRSRSVSPVSTHNTALYL
jgi:hypothetical protein